MLNKYLSNDWFNHSGNHLTVWIRVWNCWWPLKNLHDESEFWVCMRVPFCPELSEAVHLPVWWLREWVTYYSSLWVNSSIDTVSTFFENVIGDESWAKGLHHEADPWANSMTKSSPCNVTRVRDDLPFTKKKKKKRKSNFTGDTGTLLGVGVPDLGRVA